MIARCYCQHIQVLSLSSHFPIVIIVYRTSWCHSYAQALQYYSSMIQGELVAYFQSVSTYRRDRWSFTGGDFTPFDLFPADQKHIMHLSIWNPCSHKCFLLKTSHTFSTTSNLEFVSSMVFSLVIELIFLSFCCFSHLQSPCSKVSIRTHKSLFPLACKTYFRCMHNPILLNIENNGPFLAFPLVLTKFSQTYQTLLHIELSSYSR